MHKNTWNSIFLASLFSNGQHKNGQHNNNKGYKGVGFGNWKNGWPTVNLPSGSSYPSQHGSRPAHAAPRPPVVGALPWESVPQPEESSAEESESDTEASTRHHPTASEDAATEENETAEVHPAASIEAAPKGKETAHSESAEESGPDSEEGEEEIDARPAKPAHDRKPASSSGLAGLMGALLPKGPNYTPVNQKKLKPRLRPGAERRIIRYGPLTLPASKVKKQLF